MLSGQGESRVRAKRSAFPTEDSMAQFPITKTLTRIIVTRRDGEYQLQIEDESREVAVYHTGSEQILQLADEVDDLLAEEEGEQAES
jgi:hypothetical protein